MESRKLSKAISFGLIRSLLIILGVMAVLWFIWEIQAILAYIGIAAVISLIGRPIVNFLTSRCHLNNTLSVIITLILIMGLLSWLVYLIIPVIVEQRENLEKVNYEDLQSNLELLNLQASNYMGIEHIDIVSRLKQSNYFQSLDLEFLSNFINGIIAVLGDVLIAILAVTFIAFFLLKDSRLMTESVLVFAAKKNEGKFLRTFNKIKELLSRYFIGLIIQIFVVFVLYSIILLILDVTNALTIAFFCALLNLIPYLGPFFGGLLMMGFVISDNLGSDFGEILPLLIYVLVGYMIVQIIDNVVNQPLIFGKSVRSHPLEIFIVILIAGALFGIIGLVAAIPTYTAIKVIAKEFLYEYKIVKKLTSNL